MRLPLGGEASGKTDLSYLGEYFMEGEASVMENLQTLKKPVEGVGIPKVRYVEGRGLGQLMLVRIWWEDSHQTIGWHTEAPETKALRCQSVGWVVQYGDETLTIAAHMTEEEEPQRGGEMTIPTAAIHEIEVLA